MLLRGRADGGAGPLGALAALIFTVGLLLAGAAPARAANERFFVQKSNPGASDANACTAAAAPCLTVQGAVDKAKASAGNTVQVLANADGTTTDGYTAPVVLDGANPIALTGAGTGANGTEITVPTGMALRVQTASVVSALRVNSASGRAIQGDNANAVYRGVLATGPAQIGFTGVGTVFDSTLSGATGVAGTSPRLVRCVVVGTNRGLDFGGGVPDIFDSIVRSGSTTPVGTGISVLGVGATRLRLRHVTVSGFETRVSAFDYIGQATVQAVNSTFAGSSGTDLSVSGANASAELTTTNVSAARTIIGGAQVTKTDPLDVPPGLTADGHLAPGSALIDRGTAGGPLAGDPFDTMDVDGEGRSQGAARDVGADETPTLPVSPPSPGPSPPAAGAAAAAAAQSPAEGLKNCADRVTVGKDGTVKLCEATNPPTASTTQTLTGALPSKLAAAAKRKKAKKPKVLTLGSGQTNVPAGQTVPVTVKLGAKAAKVLARKGSLKVQASIEARGADGQSATVKRSVTLKAAKKKKRRKRKS